MLEARVFSSIADIGRIAWNACFPDELEDYDYLFAVERAGLEGFQWRYAVALKDGEIVGATPGFITEYSLDTTLVGTGKQIVRGLTSLFPSALTLKLGCIGSPCTETVTLGIRPDMTDQERGQVLRTLVNGFAEKTTAEGCGLQAVKDVPAPCRTMFERVLVPSGYRDIPGLPVAYLDVGFPTLDAYLQSMTPATRKDMRRKLKSRAGIRIEQRANIDDVMDRVMKLYGETRDRAEMQFETLTPAYFRSVLSDMGERSMCTLYFRDDNLLALNLLLRNSNTLLDKFFCMDGEAGRDNNLYFLSWFQNVQYCIDHGLTRYQSGQAAYANKLRLGSKLTRTAMYFRHRNPLINGALKLVAPIFATDPTAHLARAKDAEAA